MFASYSDELTTRDSVKRRDIMNSDWFQMMWDHVTFDQDRKTRYSNTRTGEMIATSVGGGGLGEHPHFIVVDDPHKTKGAESEAERTSAREWWKSTISSRGRLVGSRRVVIMQRLHEKDLSRLLIDKGTVRHVCLPLAYESNHPYVFEGDPRTEEGEPLWKAFEAAFEGMRADFSDPYIEAGQLQQRPSPAEGGTFDRSWFTVVDAMPVDRNVAVRFWDIAGTASGGDYTAGAKLVRHESGRVTVEDVRRKQVGPGERDKLMLQTASEDGRDVIIGVELQPGGLKNDWVIHVSQLLEGYTIRFVPPKGSKEFRAHPFASFASAGNVDILRGPWNDDFLDEVGVFPNGMNDDQVDGVSGGFTLLNTLKHASLAITDIPVFKELHESLVATCGTVTHNSMKDKMFRIMAIYAGSADAVLSGHLRQKSTCQIWDIDHVAGLAYLRHSWKRDITWDEIVSSMLADNKEWKPGKVIVVDSSSGRNLTTELPEVQFEVGYSTKEMLGVMPSLQDCLNQRQVVVPQVWTDWRASWQSDISAYCGDRDDDVGHITCTVNVVQEIGSDKSEWGGIIGNVNGIATTY
jgi:predicted phage terminase large subunit-like protein